MWRIAPSVNNAMSVVPPPMSTRQTPSSSLVVSQHRLTGGELLEDDVIHFEAAAAYALDNVLCRAHRAGHHVHARLQAHPGHTDGLFDTFLTVDDEFLRQDVQDFLVRGNRHRARGIDNPVHVGGGDLFVADSDDTVRIQTANMAARNPGEHRVDLATGHQLRLFHRTLNRLNRRLDVDHHPFFETARRVVSDSDNFEHTFRRYLRDNRHHLRRTNVQAHQ